MTFFLACVIIPESLRNWSTENKLLFADYNTKKILLS